MVQWSHWIIIRGGRPLLTIMLPQYDSIYVGHVVIGYTSKSGHITILPSSQNFIYIRQPAQPISHIRSVLSGNSWILACDSYCHCCWWMAPAAWLDRLIWWWWRIWRLQTTPRHLWTCWPARAHQWGGSLRSCESLLSSKVSNSWPAGVSPHDLSQCQTGLSGLCPPSSSPSFSSPFSSLHQTS